ncbi:hypothetical protein SDC9_178861 [bioreactor metagenome]|uniref:Uncharacterized protein n=1 Tax=bioreactor metagenome TaxID=1076179 RepID=A0A645GXD8_9ZZZZ
MKKYESPKLEFERISLKEGIADGNCYSQLANKTNITRYYDPDGKGWVKFTLSGNNCGNSPGFSVSHVEVEGGGSFDPNTVSSTISSILNNNNNQFIGIEILPVEPGGMS